jgi:hypothetical protein
MSYSSLCFVGSSRAQLQRPDAIKTRGCQLTF